MGILRRVVLVDLGDEILELINPEIIDTDGEQEGAEGCLSVPGIYAEVTRPPILWQTIFTPVNPFAASCAICSCRLSAASLQDFRKS